jgi:hypothetical protein
MEINDFQMLKNRQILTGTVVPGYGVASGRSPDSPYPAGTIAMQYPFFRDLGLDLEGYFLGTINLSIAPNTFKLLNADYYFEQLNWAEGFPPETFSFYQCQIDQLCQIDRQTEDSPIVPGWIYYPHPETKIGHFQSNSLLEIIAPPISRLVYGDRLQVTLSSQQIQIYQPEFYSSRF